MLVKIVTREIQYRAYLVDCDDINLDDACGFELIEGLDGEEGYYNCDIVDMREIEEEKGAKNHV
jgi:hypothetical protein